ncbi:proton channel OTOP1-like [Carassius auratus]|uniref:Proton channel OTOP1-like n=1 Tax=Carassius auratus TaxID=7957 RepID=A0A6P6QUJ4_CARAU|nr:proton channel OTOP1-like [Carassius auratus]
MVEHSGLDIVCLNKYSPASSSSSSSSSSNAEKKLFSKLKVSLTKKYPQKNAETLSAQYGTNLLLIGVSVMLALAQHGPAVKKEHLLAFITALMLVQLVWMLCYMIRREAGARSGAGEGRARGHQLDPRGADDAGVAVAHHGRVPHRIFRRISFMHLRRARSLSYRARAAHHISGAFPLVPHQRCHQEI